MLNTLSRKKCSQCEAAGQLSTMDRGSRFQRKQSQKRFFFSQNEFMYCDYFYYIPTFESFCISVRPPALIITDRCTAHQIVIYNTMRIIFYNYAK